MTSQSLGFLSFLKWAIEKHDIDIECIDWCGIDGEVHSAYNPEYVISQFLNAFGFTGYVEPRYGKGLRQDEIGLLNSEPIYWGIQVHMRRYITYNNIISELDNLNIPEKVKEDILKYTSRLHEVNNIMEYLDGCFGTEEYLDLDCNIYGIELCCETMPPLDGTVSYLIHLRSFLDSFIAVYKSICRHYKIQFLKY